MIKEWFKYEYGYVNIDSENLYLTHTGNWSEIPSLTEKAKKTSIMRSYMIKAYMAIALIGLGLFAIVRISDSAGPTLLIPLAAGGYFLYEYLKRETGYKFFIPLKKILRIEYSDKNVTITFKNKEDREESILLDKVEEKGILLLKKIEELTAGSSTLSQAVKYEETGQ